MENIDSNPQMDEQVFKMMKELYRGLFVQMSADEVVNFYQQSRDLAVIEKDKIEIKLKGIDPKKEKERYRSTKIRLNFYTRYPWYLRVNIFLMLFSLIEELLTSAYEILTGTDIQSEGFGIDRFKRPYQDIDIVLTSIMRWEFITKCQIVRNVLLHANGNITLCRNSGEIQGILSDRKWSNFFGKRKGLFTISRKGQNRTEYIAIKEAGINELLLVFHDLEELILVANNESKSEK